MLTSDRLKWLLVRYRPRDTGTPSCPVRDLGTSDRHRDTKRPRVGRVSQLCPRGVRRDTWESPEEGRSRSGTENLGLLLAEGVWKVSWRPVWGRGRRRNEWGCSLDLSPLNDRDDRVWKPRGRWDSRRSLKERRVTVNRIPLYVKTSRASLHRVVPSCDRACRDWFRYQTES